MHRFYRYTLVVDDKEKAAKFERDLPKALSPSEFLVTFPHVDLSDFRF